MSQIDSKVPSSSLSDEDDNDTSDIFELLYTED